MEREQRPGGDREIPLASLATPARCPSWTTARPHRRATAVRAVRLTLVVSPSEPNEDSLDLFIAHPHDGRQCERPGAGGEEEVSGHMCKRSCVYDRMPRLTCQQ
jgi:hypothetical protein